MLSSITLRRFKNLEDVKIPLGRINVMVGTNNSGKSSVLQGVAFGVSVAQTAFVNGNAKTLSPDSLIYAPLRDVSALAHGGELKTRKEQAIEVVFCGLEANETGEAVEIETTVQVRKGKNSNLAIGIDGPLKPGLESVDEPFAMYVPGLAGLPGSEPYRTPAALRRAAARGDANSVLRNVLLSLKEDPVAWTEFAANLARVFRDHSVEVSFDPNFDEFVDARVVSPKGSLPIDLEGTGFLQTVQILAYTAKYRPKLLLLDEPDSHIHPDRQRALISLLAELAEQKDFQVLIATHSRHLLDEVVRGERFHWMSDGKRIEEDKIDRVRVLTDLGALDSGDLLKTGQVDAVLLTEDTLTEPIQILLESSGFDMQRTQVWSYSGCTKIDAADVLARFIQDHAPGTEVIVHQDRDYRSGDEVEGLRARFQAKSLHFFVTDGTDAESHLVELRHIRSHYPQASDDQVNAVIADATARVRDQSVTSLARKRVEEDKSRRRAEGNRGDPDPVSITDTARADFDLNPQRWRHGKKTLGHVIAGLQQQLGANPNLLRPSPALRHPTLAEVAEAIAQRRSELPEVAAPPSPVTELSAGPPPSATDPLTLTPSPTAP
jgi:energy-coupling factor transporter ATP-binding protein EcfA2